MSKRWLTAVAVLSVELSLPGLAGAQVPPDAGSVLKELQRTEPAPKPAPARPELRVPDERAAPADGGAKIAVKGFLITGATLIPADELTREVSAHAGSEQTLADLRKIALRISELYRRKGYFARALIPEQRVANGIVEIAVIEGKLAAVDAEMLPGTRFSSERTRQFILSQQPLAEPLSPDAVRWGLNNLNDLPGVSATGVLQPGDAQGDVKLGVRVESTPLFNASVYADNHGLKATGQARAIGFGQLNNPLSIGDQLTLLGVVTQRSDFEKVGYSMPLGYSGLRAGVSAARLGYRLGGNFRGNSGNARIFGATLSQPLLRTRSANFYGGLAVDYKRFINDGTGNLNISNKTLKTAGLQLRGDFTDGFWGAAASAFSVGVVSGDLDLSRNADNLTQDQSGARTQGGFIKLPWSVQRVQFLPGGWDVSVTASGQIAAGNLDGYEKFSLGGPTGVRAYPAGEALGDDGVLATVELRRAFNAEFHASAFVDAGHIKQWHNIFAGAAGVGAKPNSYALYGMGIGMQYGRSGDWVIKGSVAWKLGNNPGRDANGKDADGGDSKVRAWIQLAKFF